MEDIMMKVIRKLPITITLLTTIILRGFASQMTFIQDAEKGTLTVRDGKVAVLTYCYGDQLKEGIDPEQTRSCYIHPLYSLDGKPLTDDFPSDHLHHHGLFWTWPVVKTRGQETQTWHPANLRQHFSRWLKREILDDSSTLSVENDWKLGGKEVVAKETVTLHVHPAENSGRVIDLALTLEAVGGPLELRGTPDQNKGYGGLTLRGAPPFKDFPILTDRGELEGEVNNLNLRWAGLSTEKRGVAIFVSPHHPDFPPSWVLRTSYAGLLNVSWPGLQAVVLQPGQPVTLHYRIYIHRGDVAASYIQQAYSKYASENKQR